MRAAFFHARSAATAAFLHLATFLIAVPAQAGGPVEVGAEVHFTDLSTNDPFLFVWDFDYDGLVPITDSLDQNPVWIYPEPGVYEVFLETCNLYGCASVTKTVVVQEDPQVIFSDDFGVGDLSLWSAVVGDS
jgi:PKD repeat protein